MVISAPIDFRLKLNSDGQRYSPDRNGYLRTIWLLATARRSEASHGLSENRFDHSRRLVRNMVKIAHDAAIDPVPQNKSNFAQTANDLFVTLGIAAVFRKPTVSVLIGEPL